MSAHISVLRDEVVSAVTADRLMPERVIDGTLGAGGHTLALVERGVGHVLGLDVDLQALAIARERLSGFIDAGRVTVQHRSYTAIAQAADEIGWSDGVDGIVLDLGVSSMQVDTAERGFAFMKDGPLDMRFDPAGGGITAADIVNSWDERDIADALFRWGEEREARRIARAIAAGRPFTSTRQLAEAVKKAVPLRGKPSPIHPATRTFQALRIAVNDELASVEHVLPVAIHLLRPGGRLAIISFHSLEDRIVKHAFRDASLEIAALPGMQSMPTKAALGRVLTRKPIDASAHEIEHNPRSRSAKLRVFERT
ncbi:MAG: 16S rRNA (cytosine(1402)-N(4))-methyltransferase RsmH [Chloroflexi bacterium]|nr:16S rRNA (cytosine(1402)-N(4))-methyltransferase RsmH [Chloroflexota bacterium]